MRFIPGVLDVTSARGLLSEACRGEHSARAAPRPVRLVWPDWASVAPRQSGQMESRVDLRTSPRESGLKPVDRPMSECRSRGWTVSWTADRGDRSAARHLRVDLRGPVWPDRVASRIRPFERAGYAHPTGPDTIYILASISKPIAVCGLMLLVELGDVVLSDRVQRYLPEFEGEHKDKVRVWHLLSHTSGLPDQLPENTELRRASCSPEPLRRESVEDASLSMSQGKGFGYQSMGTLLAGEIVEPDHGPAAEGTFCTTNSSSRWA